ncbi:hypothetical protein [Sphingobium subterraneum]|uniref:Uncharacterized protein n=1 Tax=Sphingobium subterraneum TaxID=627688 RepID=A0A841J274_9SPHN|nr:hypothetical protein [Sphingobium subterraneum]MBB6125279.1 hypothetical protein [Sphingobium subterraneum]
MLTGLLSDRFGAGYGSAMGLRIAMLMAVKLTGELIGSGEIETAKSGSSTLIPHLPLERPAR